MAKKRTSLDSLFATAHEVETSTGEKKPRTMPATIEKKTTETQPEPLDDPKATAAPKTKSEIVKQTVYLPSAVHEQMRQLAFEERRKMHDYLVEGLDLVFKNRGLKSYGELSDETK